MKVLEGFKYQLTLILVIWSFTCSVEGNVHFYTDIKMNSPAMEIIKIDSSWENPGSDEYAQGRARIGSVWQLSGRWGIGLERRWDYHLGFNHDTSQFYSGLENNEIADGIYDLDLSVNVSRSKSLYLLSIIPLSSDLRFWLKSHFIQGERGQFGYLRGQGQVTSSQLSYKWDLEYQYDENKIFEGSRLAVSGWGHSFDIGFTYQLNESNQLNLEVLDAFYRLYWKGLGRDEGCINRPLTPDCVVFSQKANLTQSFPVLLSGSWVYIFPNGLSMTSNLQKWSRHESLFASLGWKHYQIGYDLVNDSYNLGYESTYLKVKWSADKLNYEAAKHWQLTLDMNWPLL